MPRTTTSGHSGRPRSSGGQPEGTRRLRLVVAYDGASFSGFARQAGRRTVQGEIEAALERLARAPVATVGAGRTDTGVHARGQVLHADVPPTVDVDRAAMALTSMLEPAVVVGMADWAPPGFDARFSASRRTYVYRLDEDPAPDPLQAGFVWQLGRQLRVPAMRLGAGCLVGEHDFAAFCRKREGATTVRTLRSLSVRRAEHLVQLRMVADAFCHQMVRSLVGYLVEVGLGRHAPEQAAAVLASADRSCASQLAPPHGLVLEAVTYPPGLGGRLTWNPVRS